MLQLYNTASRSIEPFTPQKEGGVSLYACGLTVYDYTHLGHLRKYTMDDVLVRVLRHLEYDVTFVQNVTDVGHLASDADTGEDKLEKGAKKYGESVWDIARRFEEYFFYSMDLMGAVRPDISCRATDHIQQQLAMVLELEKKGHTYVIEGDGVYFDTSTFPEYGKMARISIEQQEAGARVSAEGKRNPSDFALWKFERAGENRAMVWPSPWSERSFPGWHIECSAMAQHYLGDQLDIHTGGIDHIPVHHTNEIAQAEAATDAKPFVRFWVHHNFLRVDNQKMSKSLNNFFTIDDVLERGFDPRALRMLFLTTQYRAEMNFTWKNLKGAQKAFVRLRQKVVELKQSMQHAGTIPEIDTWSKDATKLHKQFFAALYDDLNTARASAVLWDTLKSELDPAEKLAVLLAFDQIFNIGIAEWYSSHEAGSQSQAVPRNVLELVAQREQAREQKDWKQSDALRDQILDLGYRVSDAADGQNIEKL